MLCGMPEDTRDLRGRGGGGHPGLGQELAQAQFSPLYLSDKVMTVPE